MTAPGHLRIPETPPDTYRRLAEEAAAIIAALAGAPEHTADHDAGTDHRHIVDTPTPGGSIALKSAAHRWGRSKRSMKKLAADHRALHRVGGRLMVDDRKLRAGIFGQVFPLSSY